jgi:hypothetical protein
MDMVWYITSIIAQFNMDLRLGELKNASYAIARVRACWNNTIQRACVQWK